VSIAVVLELCGVSSLAFAVGVYLPLSSSTPIFVGGLARYVADKWGRRDTAGKTPEQIEAEAETSPGSLLSTGYIAGGAIAGVLIAFLSFSDTIPRVMATWQYRTTTFRGDLTLKEAATTAASNQLGIENGTADEKKEVDALADDIIELNSDLKARFTKVPAGVTLVLPKQQKFETKSEMTLGEVAKQALGSEGSAALLFNLNVETVVRVPAGKIVKLPGKRDPDPSLVAGYTGLLISPAGPGPLLAGSALYPGALHLGTNDDFYVAPGDMTLGEVAKVTAPATKEGEKTPTDFAARASELYELNKKELEPEVVLPAGTELKLPQKTWPAMVMFGLLTLFLIVVGMGWLFRAPTNSTAT
jgi:hypothetical protein